MRAALATYRLDISEPKSTRGVLSDYRLYIARWALSDLGFWSNFREALTLCNPRSWGPVVTR